MSLIWEAFNYVNNILQFLVLKSNYFKVYPHIHICKFKMLSMSLIFFMSKLFQHSLWYCCSLFWLSKYSLGNFSHWNVFDSVMEHFRISLYEWWNIFDRKKWCRKFSVENFAVENFPSLTVEHFPLLMNPFVEKILSKIVCFPDLPMRPIFYFSTHTSELAWHT